VIRNIKPKWSKPKLIILMRGKPDSVVLDICKNMFDGSTGPNQGNNGCEYYNGFMCANCSNTLGS